MIGLDSQTEKWFDMSHDINYNLTSVHHIMQT